MRQLLVVTLAAALLSPAAAFAQKVSTDHDSAANFAAFRTYYWMKDAVTGNSLVDQRLHDALDRTLQTKGLQKVPEGQADLALGVHVATRERQTLNTFYDSFGPGWGFGGWGGSGMATTNTSTYVEGTLLVDLFDAKTKKLVWRATAQGTVSDNPEKNAKKINSAAEKMFKKFPPRAPGTN